MARPDFSVLWWFRAQDAAVSLNVYEPHGHVREHRHASDQVCILLSGAYDAFLEGQRIACSRGDAVFHPAGASHADRLAGEPCLSLRVEWSARSRGDRTASPRRRASAELAKLAAGLVDDMSNPSSHRGRWTELRAALDQEVLGGDGRSPSRQAGPAPAWFERAYRFVCDHYLDAIGLRDVAAAAGRGRTHVAAAFRCRFGVSIGELVHQLRVEHAEMLMLDRDRTLGQVAVESGFSDQPHFNRVFVRARGIAPSQWRRRGVV